MDQRVFGLRQAYSVVCTYLRQRDDAVDRTARDVDIFEAKTVPPATGRYRQAG